MAKREGALETDSKKSVYARCHCIKCKLRFNQKIEFAGDLKKGLQSATKCKMCEEKEVVSLLIYDSSIKT